MSKIIISSSELRNTADRMKALSDNFSLTSNNVLWTTSLSLEEQFMLKDVKKEFMAKTLNSQVDYIGIVDKYYNLKDYYSRKESIKIGVEMFGFDSSEFEKYDYNLTFEEAVPYYMGYTVQEIEEFCRNVEEADNKFQIYLNDIREKYNGNLGILVGKNIEDYASVSRTYEQGVQAFAEHVKGFMSSDSVQVMQNNFSKTLEECFKIIKERNGIQNSENEQIMLENENDDLNYPRR